MNTNLTFGLKRGDISAQLYVENLFDDHSVTYIHPEAFLVSRLRHVAAAHHRHPPRLRALIGGGRFRPPIGMPELTRPQASASLVAAMLTFVYVLNFLDRQLIGILAKPIQDSLQVSDGQLGLIGGLYFAMFYCFIAIPVGWLADRTNRVNVLSLACAIWSGATIACGMARDLPAARRRAHARRLR